MRLEMINDRWVGPLVFIAWTADDLYSIEAYSKNRLKPVHALYLVGDRPEYKSTKEGTSEIVALPDGSVEIFWEVEDGA